MGRGWRMQRPALRTPPRPMTGLDASAALTGFSTRAQGPNHENSGWSLPETFISRQVTHENAYEEMKTPQEQMKGRNMLSKIHAPQKRGASNSLPGARIRAFSALRTPRTMLSVLLALLLVFAQPVLPSILRLNPHDRAEAQAFVGTTDYHDLFDVAGIAGSMDGDGLFTCANVNKNQYVNRYGGFWSSDGSLYSKGKISFLHDWTIKATANFPTPAFSSAYYVDITSNFGISFPEANRAVFLRLYTTNSGTEYSINTQNISNSQYIATTKIGSIAPDVDASMSYVSATDRLTFRVGNYVHAVTGIGKAASSQSITLWGSIGWKEKSVNNKSTRPPSMSNMTFRFNSMTLPHLDPEIKDLSIYPGNGDAAYGKDAMIEDGSIVRVECTVKNKSASAGSERFPLHLKRVDENEHPTQGVAPFIDEDHPLTVTQGSNVLSSATSAGADTILGANGTPLTFVGSSEYKITYFARIDQSAGEAIKLSQCLTEDSFKGKYYATTELVAEKELIEGEDEGDGGEGETEPDGGSGTGANQNARYSRTPKANDFGWNNGPVSVGFYASDAFDSFVIKRADAHTGSDAPEIVARGDDGDVAASDDSVDGYGARGDDAGGNAGDGVGDDVIKVLDADNPKWTQSEDTDGLDLTYQARNSDMGVGTTIRPDTIRIDTLPPTLTYNASSNELVASDAAENPAFDGKSHATSGIWKIVRVSNEDQAESDSSNEQIYSPTNGVWTAQQSMRPELGTYIAVDVAGNVSEPVEVASVGAPVVARPDVSGDVPDGDNVTNTYTGPVFKGSIPKGQIETDENGLQHTTIGEKHLEIIDPDAYPFDGTLTTEIAEEIVKHNYAFVSGAGEDSRLDVEINLLDKEGNPIDSVDTTETSQTIIRAVATDIQGNTTTVELTYQIASKDDLPTVNPNPDTNPNKPGGSGSGGANTPENPSNPNTPDTPDPDKGSPFVPIDPSSEARLDPDKTGTIDDTPYFEFDKDKPLDLLDVIEVKPDGDDDWTDWKDDKPDPDDPSGTDNPNDPSNPSNPGSSNDSTNPDNPGNPDDPNNPSNPGNIDDPQSPTLPDNVKVEITDETGNEIDGTVIEDPGTYELTVSVLDPDTGEFVVIAAIPFHVIDTSITDTDLIYKDVPKTHWGHDKIFDIGPKVINGAINPSNVALGYMKGYAGTTNFGPEANIIRGDAAIVVWRMAGCPDVEGTNSDNARADLNSNPNSKSYLTGFSDCDQDPSTYCNKAILWCKQQGIVVGYAGTDEFRPQNNISREEFASIIARFAAYKGKDVAADVEQANLAQYSDYTDISEWANNSMKYVTYNKIMTGKGTTDSYIGILDPQSSITRAEVAKMIYLEQPVKHQRR